jgi:hypothetical protein
LISTLQFRKSSSQKHSAFDTLFNTCKLVDGPAFRQLDAAYFAKPHSINLTFLNVINTWSKQYIHPREFPNEESCMSSEFE